MTQYTVITLDSTYPSDETICKTALHTPGHMVTVCNNHTKYCTPAMMQYAITHYIPQTNNTVCSTTAYPL